jgi:membrane glycosyltransferase
MSSASLAPQPTTDGAPTTFSVPADRLFQDWKAAHDRASSYLGALGVPPADHEGLARSAIERALQEADWADRQGAVAATLRALRELIPQRYPTPAKAWHAALSPFLAWRLDVWLAQRLPPAIEAPVSAPLRDGSLASMPRLGRRSMVPERIERRFSRRVVNRLLGKSQAASPGEVLRGRALYQQRRQLPWIHAARRRRVFLTVLVLIPSIVAAGFMQSVLPHQGSDWLEFAIVLFFGALFGWISIGFWTALLGFFTLAFKRDRFTITNLEPVDWHSFQPQGRTAIVMPICHEPVDRVFAGLRTIYDSLQRTGAMAHFDFFVLSDSADPSTCIQEEEAWASWCRDVGGFARIFYRRRKVRQKRKSGNVADFCRRWGTQYSYMIMLDADSIMAGETLVRLVQMIDKHPTVGMIQTAPVAVNRRSLLARVQQFAGRVYGPMFAAGLHFWQLGDGQYWGHNAILRVKPFIDHCGLPRLPGKPPLGGEIMSHDFVEAALMGRSGWNLWLAFDLEGSYEEVPSTLLEEMGRDRRWCQGNLQHLRLLFTEGLFGAHRALFLNGVLSYVSALLWNAFLGLSTIEAIRDVFWEPEYFPHGASLFPEWPIWRPGWAMYLMAVTGMILFLPKVLSIVLIIVKREAAAYGGALRLLLSVVLEILLSSLLAPIRMVFHSRFVMQNLIGRTVQWHAQGREDSETGWLAAIRHHGLDTMVASAWGTGLYWLNPFYFWWVTPIIVALILSIPTSVFSSRVSLGGRARRWRLFLIPEECSRPRELLDLDRYQAQAEQEEARLHPAERDGFVRAAVDPYVNALHRALLGRSRSLRRSIRAARRALLDQALAAGPAALGARQRRILLSDPDLVTELHESVWSLPDEAQAGLWGRPGAARP